MFMLLSDFEPITFFDFPIFFIIIFYILCFYGDLYPIVYSNFKLHIYSFYSSLNFNNAKFISP